MPGTTAVCLVGDRLQRRRLLAVVARTIWPMVEAGRVFTCDMPYSRDRERQMTLDDLAESPGPEPDQSG